MSETTDHDLLIRIDERTTKLWERLLGNGQPGELANMDVKTNKAFRRIRGLERAMWVVLGGSSLFAWIFKDHIIETLVK